MNIVIGVVPGVWNAAVAHGSACQYETSPWQPSSELHKRRSIASWYTTSEECNLITIVNI